MNSLHVIRKLKICQYAEKKKTRESVGVLVALVQQGPGTPLLGQPYKEATQFSLLQSSGSPTKSVPGTASGLAEVMRDPTKHADMHYVVRQFTLVAKVAHSLFYACLLCVRLARPVAKVHKKTLNTFHAEKSNVRAMWQSHFFALAARFGRKGEKGEYHAEGLTEPHLGTTALEKTNTAL